VQLFAGEGHVNAYWQPWGQPQPDQLFPHRAFRVATAARLDEIIGRLGEARVPHVLATREPAADGAEVAVALYVRDPDGNQLELRCERYPFRHGIQVGAFEPSQQYYPWTEWRARVAEGGSPRTEA
jgi:hypothetical protein